MADSKKYFWLKLKTDFFKGYKAKLLRAYDNGDTYLLLYLMLLLESISHDGNLRFSETLAYDEKSLSIICDTNVDIVKSALKAFQDLELIEIWDDKTLHMKDLAKMIGSETESARKKKAYREKIALQSELRLEEKTEKDNVPEMSPKCPIELDIELELELEKDIDIKNKPLSLNTTVDVPKKVKYDYLNDCIFLAKSEKIIKHLNNTLDKPDNKKFSDKSKATLSLIHARLKDGRTVKDFEYVIENQFAYWHNTDMQKFLRPQTLFGNKFEGYLMSDKCIDKPKDLNQKPKYERPRY